MAAPAFAGASAIGASTAGTFTITLPAHVADDVFLCLSWYRASATVPTPTGWTQAATWLRGTTRYYLHWSRAASSTETNPVFDYTGTDDGFGLVCSYRGCGTTGDPYNVLGTTATGTVNTATLNGITTLVAESLVVALIGGEDNTATTVTMTATDPAAFTEHYVESATGTDGCVAIGEAARATAGATGNISAAWGTSVVGWGGVVLSLPPLPAGQNVTVAGRTSSSSFGSVSFTTGGVTKAVSGRTSVSSFGTVTAVPGNIAVAVAGRTSVSSFGTVTGGAPPQSTSASGRTSASSFGAVSTATGGVSVSISGRTTVSSFGSLTAAPGGVVVSPAGLTSVSSYGSLTVVPGGTSVGMSGWTSTSSYGVSSVAGQGETHVLVLASRRRRR